MKQTNRSLALRSAVGMAAILAAGTAPAVIKDMSALRDSGAVVLGHRTLDHATLDAAAMAYQPINPYGDMRGMPLMHAYPTHDSASRPVTLPDGTTVARTVDSTGAFLIGELERLDPALHLPLSNVSWSRDIDLRGDVTIADDFSSFTETNFGSAGTLGAGNSIRNGKAWMGKSTDQIGGVGVDIAKTASPMMPWGLEVRFTVFELEAAAKMGRPIDDQKLTALHLKHQMDTDEQVYVGDGTLNVGGLLNHPRVTNVSNVPNGTGGTATWATKTPDEILADVNNALQSAWAASAFAVMPRNILIPPTQFGLISTRIVSSAGSVSILKYLLENNIVKASGNGDITIKPCKWCVGAGAGGTIGTAGNDRMVVYTKSKEYVRFPMTTLQRTPVQFQSIYHMTTYYCRLGVVEVVYPETIAYRDGI